MTARVMILVLLAASRGVWWCLEQPSSSIMELHPTFQRMLGLLDVYKLSVSMGDFGAPSQKATTLYSSRFPLS